MEFGRVPDEELDKIDFSLPKEPAENKSILSGKKLKDAKVYIGCAKWGRPEWVGKIYPPKTRERNFLDQYLKHYNAIELNATHYKIIGPRGIAKWAAKAKGKDFLFCPKMYQGVTHKGRLHQKQFYTSEFLRGVVAFEENLGPIFIQMNETFGPKRKDELFSFLKTLPQELQFFLELRHRDWFAKKEIKEELLSTLTALNMGIVITDTADRRDCAHMHLTIPKTFIRFVGNSLHSTDFPRIDAWVQRIKYWLNHGMQEIFFFMHMHDEATSPELSAVLIDKINETCGLQIPRPIFLKEFSTEKLK